MRVSDIMEPDGNGITNLKNYDIQEEQDILQLNGVQYMTYYASSWLMLTLFGIK